DLPLQDFGGRDELVAEDALEDAGQGPRLAGEPAAPFGAGGEVLDVAEQARIQLPQPAELLPQAFPNGGDRVSHGVALSSSWREELRRASMCFKMLTRKCPFLGQVRGWRGSYRCRRP